MDVGSNFFPLEVFRVKSDSAMLLLIGLLPVNKMPK